MITLDDVTLSFPDGDSRITAVDRVSLDVPPGIVTGITGPSGSGKSSLLAVAATLIRPDSGHVWIDDVDAAALSPRDTAALRRDEIGIVFQQSNLLPSLTAREQLLVMASVVAPTSCCGLSVSPGTAGSAPHSSRAGSVNGSPSRERW
jgi:putative ABC transport system ATP-binding protein